MRKLLPLLVVLSGLGCASAPAPNVRTITLEASGAPFGSVLSTLRDRTGLEIRWPGDVSGSLDLAFSECPWDVALDAVAHAGGLVAEWDGDGLVLSAEGGEGEPFAARPVPGPEPRALRPLGDRGRDEELPSQPRVEPTEDDLPLPPEVDPGPVREVPPGIRVSPAGLPYVELNVTDMPLGEVVASIAKLVGVQATVDPNLDLSVTSQLRGIDYELALALLAKTYSCELMQDEASNLHLGPTSHLYLSFTEAPLRKVLWLLAQYCGVHLVMDADLDDRVTVDCGGGGLDVDHDVLSPSLKAIARTCDVSIELRDGVLLVGRTPTGWGEANRDLDLKGHLERTAEPSGDPRVTVRAEARGAPAVAWFRMLAGYTGRQLVIAQTVSGRITASSVAGGDWLEIMRETAATHGVHLEEAGDFLLLRDDDGSVPEGPAPAGQRVELPDGRTVAVSLEATVTFEVPKDAPWLGHASAVLNGVVCRVGDPVRAVASDEDLPLWVHEILPAAAHLRVEGRTGKVVVSLPAK